MKVLNFTAPEILPALLKQMEEGESAKQSIKAIKELEAKFVGSIHEFAYAVGMHLSNLEEQLGRRQLAETIRHEFSFSVERAMAFKRFYEVGKESNLDVKIIGVDRTLALIAPLKIDSETFLTSNPIEELKKKSVKEVRRIADEFVEERTRTVQGDEKAFAFFLKAEDSLKVTVDLFNGIDTRFSKEYKGWIRRNVALLKSQELLKLLEGLQ